MNTHIEFDYGEFLDTTGCIYDQDGANFLVIMYVKIVGGETVSYLLERRPVNEYVSPRMSRHSVLEIERKAWALANSMGAQYHITPAARKAYGEAFGEQFIKELVR